MIYLPIYTTKIAQLRRWAFLILLPEKLLCLDSQNLKNTIVARSLRIAATSQCVLLTKNLSINNNFYLH